MKRPEGFDPTSVDPRAGEPRSRRSRPAEARPSRPPRRTKPSRQSTAGAPGPVTRRQLRRAARERRRVEKAEVRRFTRRARERRIVAIILASLLATLVGLVVIAVFSPLLALRTITVDGTSRISPTEVSAALDDQLGTPLALLDLDRITRDLTPFPLIRSYVTEVVPPDTLRIHIVERSPVGSVLVGGAYNLVDPAGIVLEQSAERMPGVPLLDLPGGDVSDSGFAPMVRVLLALPPDVLSQVDSVSASTRDDVSLVLVGVGQGVTWGSSDDSARKAALLAALIGLTDPSQPGTFDVSAPGNGVFRPS